MRMIPHEFADAQPLLLDGQGSPPPIGWAVVIGSAPLLLAWWIGLPVMIAGGAIVRVARRVIA
jgi:zinc transporter ZupT